MSNRDRARRLVRRGRPAGLSPEMRYALECALEELWDAIKDLPDDYELNDGLTANQSLERLARDLEENNRRRGVRP